jgi:serine/threonine protein kinase
LLSAYTWKATHSLIFPLLGKNLKEFMSKERPEQLQSDASIFAALAHLSLGLEHVHNSIAKFVKLELIGCHHDLKPDNIFLNGESFVLADFGLSTFEDISHDSKTTRKIAGTSYSAPECEDISNADFTKGRVGRESDVWAFGCIIAEMLTYVSLGPTGVDDFRKKRVFTMQDIWTFSSFHCGNCPNPEVDAWLSTLETSATTSRRTLVQLIRRMLQINPAHRPNISDVAIELQAIALQEKIYPIDKLFNTLCEKVKNEEEVATLFVEHARYRSWKEICGITEDKQQNAFENFQDLEFDACLDILSKCQDTLEEIMYQLPDKDHTHLFLPLRHLNGRLQQLLPSRLREELQTRLVQNTIVATRDHRLLGKTQQALESDPYSLSASKLVKVKLMTEVAEESWQQSDDGPRLDVEMAFVHLEKDLEHHRLGRISTPDPEIKHHVLIEWIHYGTQVLPETEARKRTQRVEAVARLLHSIPHPPGFRLLRCSNFFHDPAESRFGLAFDFPSMSLEDKCSEANSVTCLSELLVRSKTDQSLRPPLGERFRLAQALTSSLSEFHKAGWLHRSISPHNIVFFQSDGASTAHGDPYVIGFSHSRPNHLNEFTEGPGDECRDYQHPEYITYPQRYKINFDYYSLGIVLLEIAHWKQLSKLTAGSNWKVLSPANFRLALIKQAKSSSLIHTMGTRYCQAIVACLGGPTRLLGDGGFDGSGDVIQLQRNFQSLVVDELAKCSA